MWWFDDLVLGYTGSSFWHYLTSIYDIYVEWLRTVVIVHYNLSSKEARIGQHEIAVIRYGVIDHGETRRLLLPKIQCWHVELQPSLGHCDSALSFYLVIYSFELANSRSVLMYYWFWRDSCIVLNVLLQYCAKNRFARPFYRLDHPGVSILEYILMTSSGGLKADMRPMTPVAGWFRCFSHKRVCFIIWFEITNKFFGIFVEKNLSNGWNRMKDLMILASYALRSYLNAYKYLSVNRVVLKHRAVIIQR